MKRKLICLFALWVGWCTPWGASAENANISGVNYMYTPATQAWQMVRYGDVGTNLYTGTCSLSIPIYTYKDEDFTIPVTLDYSYNGLLPNVPSGMVGLGWNLGCGGVITREINGIPDEFTVGYYEMNGFYHAHKYRESDFVEDPMQTMVVEPGGGTLDEFVNGKFDPYELQTLGLNVNQTYHQVLNASKGSKFETDPDIFRFNFLGYSGAFMFGYDNKIHVFDSNVPFGEITVEISDATFVRASSGADSQSVIVIRTGDGYRYTFGGGVAAVDSSYTQYDASIGNMGGYAYEPDEMMIPPTAWHLSKIEAPNGRSVVFNYIPKRAIEASYVVTTGQVTTSETGPGSEGTDISSNKEVFSYTYAAIPSEAVIDGRCRIAFDYVEKEQREGQNVTWLTHPIDLFEENYGDHAYTMPRLSGIRVEYLTDPQHPVALKTCTLSQDYTAGNPKMLLRQVTLSGEGNYRMNYEGESKNFPNLDTFAIDFWGYWNDWATRDTFIPECTYNRTSYATQNEETVVGTSRDAVFEKAKYGALSRIRFPTGGHSQFVYEAHDYGHAVVRSPYAYPHLEKTGRGRTGGIRIRKITNHDGLQEMTREFFYTVSWGGSESSGNLLRMPRYRLFFCAELFGNWRGKFSVELPGFNFRSMDATHIEYGQVYEKLTNGSIIAHTFSNYDGHSDRYNVDFLAGRDIIQTEIKEMSAECLYRLIAEPSPSSHLARGKLLCRTEYDARMREVACDTYEYANFVSGSVNTYRYAVDQFYLRYIYADNYTLYRHTRTRKTDDGKGFGGQEMTQRNISGQIEYTQYSAPGQDERRTYYFYALGESPELTARGLAAARIAEVGAEVRSDGEEYLTGAVRFDYDLSKTNPNPVAVRTAVLPEPVKRGARSLRVSLDRFPELQTMDFDTVRLKYNDALRLVEARLPGGRVTSYVWDRHAMYPIARIDNASIGQVCAFHPDFSQLATACFSRDALTDAQAATLRGIPNSLVSVYRYIPFVGLSEQEDPSGRKTSYRYDALGRLSGIRDTDGKLVKAYDYKLKTQ